MCVIVNDSVKSIGVEAFKGSGIYTNTSNWENGALYINNCLVAVDKKATSYTIKPGTRLIAGGVFKNCSTLTSITIPESVISIAEKAFEGCTALTTITIPESVMSIGNEAFEDCTSLTFVTIPSSVKSIECNAFRGCSFTSITIPNGVISIEDRVFEECYSLTSVTIPSSVKSIGYMAFCDCSYLTSVKYTGTKGQWNKIEKSGWADNSYIQVVRCTDGEIIMSKPKES